MRTAAILLLAGLLALLTAAPPPATAQTAWKLPPLDKGWHWQIDGNALNLQPAQSGRTKVYDVDVDWYSAADVARLKALGQYVVGYTVVGVWESYRPDAAQFPKSVIGGKTGWDGERWLDIRPAALAQYRAILERRFDVAKAKGFDAIEGDYQNNLSDCPPKKAGCFPTSLADQEAFNRWYIDAVHARGMAAVLKNAPEYAQKYAGWGYDAALVEQCWEFSECGGYKAFVAAGKPVWNAEYKGQQAAICPKANAIGLNTARFPLNLTGQVTWACR